MTAIGSLVFCNDCGNLLEARTTAKRKKITCEVCSAVCKDTSEKVVITRSKPSDFPSALRVKRSEVQEVTEDDLQHKAITKEPCENCGNDEAEWYSQQTRSADEGSTIFYTCTKCNHKWSTNN